MHSYFCRSKCFIVRQAPYSSDWETNHWIYCGWAHSYARDQQFPPGMRQQLRKVLRRDTVTPIRSTGSRSGCRPDGPESKMDGDARGQIPVARAEPSQCAMCQASSGNDMRIIMPPHQSAYNRKLKMNIGIVGHGVVGSAVVRFFSKCRGHRVVIYDKHQREHSESKVQVNECDLVFVCVPTPVGSDGMSCDLSAVEECVRWIEAPICIRSTVPPGTCDRLAKETGQTIVFSPEYLGEQPEHPWPDEASCGFLIVGGAPAGRDLVISAYLTCAGTGKFLRTTAVTAELCKYMENCFLATKVAFVNQFYDIAGVFGVPFSELRELWLADPRIGPSHTTVTEKRGFGGRCLPKDVAAMTAIMRLHGGAPLLEAVLKYNRHLRLDSPKGIRGTQ